MTEWYSPKEKLPCIPIGQHSINVYTASLQTDGKYFYWDACVMTFDPDYCGRETLFHSVDCYDERDTPDFWCYLPFPPNELIDMLTGR